MSPRWGPRKYDPLAAYLAQHRDDRVTLGFAELEVIIEAPLPPSARRRSWWANTPAASAQARAWRQVGWSVLTVNFGTRTVTFARLPPDSTA